MNQRAPTTSRRLDRLIGMLLALAALALYAATLLPGIGGRDTAEFQWVAPTLGLAHPTGYPLYTVLGWLWSQLPLGGSAAWRMNLFSAVASAAALGVLYLCGRALGQRPAVAAAAALALATSLTFWSQATIAEVYGLAALLQAALFLALLRWRAGRWPLWAAGLALGLGLAHHRTVLLLLPGALLFVALARLPRLREAAAAVLATGAGCLFYLYLLLHVPPGADPWPLLWAYASGADLASNWFDPARLSREGPGRVLDLAARFVWPQLLPVGAAGAALGAAALLRRDRAGAALLIGGYLTVTAFCAAYYVDDIEVFFLPAHLIAALLLGQGAMLLLDLAAQPRPNFGRSSFIVHRSAFRLQPSAFALFLLPALLAHQNLPTVRQLNTDTAEVAARTIMKQPIAHGALIIGDWYSCGGLRYLQAVEGYRSDLQLGLLANQELILSELARDRPVYLIEPNPSIGLTQVPEGSLWRVSDRPLAGAAQVVFKWEEGITLGGYTLAPGPYAPGEPVALTLDWLAQATPTAAYTLFVHVVAEDGTIYGQHDRAPFDRPTSGWQPGERYVDMYSPTLSPSAPPGRYRINIGWYDPASMRRLGLAASKHAPGGFLTLGVIEVEPR